MKLRISPDPAAQAAELIIPTRKTSGAKALFDLICFMPGINPRPTVRLSFSASCKAQTV
jgi:hypothetical protein